jgi:RimJ/RimL family protein N-acetyltransferase
MPYNVASVIDLEHRNDAWIAAAGWIRAPSSPRSTDARTDARTVARTQVREVRDLPFSPSLVVAASWCGSRETAAMSTTNAPTPPRSTTAYRIETKRLVLRPWEFKDADAMRVAVAASVDHLLPWLPWALFEPQSVDDKYALIRRFRAQFDLDADHVYGIFADDDRTVIGGTGLHNRIGPGAREIGYWIHVDHVRRGYAREATAALTKVGFEAQGLRKIEIRVQPENTASLGIPIDLGYQDTGTLRSVCPGLDPSRFHDARVFSLMATEYPASPSVTAEVRALDGLGRELLV